MKSIFRPWRVPDPSILDDHRALLRQLERRKLLRGGLSLGALSLLTGCDVTRPKSVENALLAISDLNDGVQEFIFDPNKLAPTYPASMVLKPPKFNAKYDVMFVKPVDMSKWRLELSGKVADKKPWSLTELAALPQRSMIVKHICVEGWDYIGQWSGVPLRDFLTRIGANLRHDGGTTRGAGCAHPERRRLDRRGAEQGSEGHHRPDTCGRWGQPG
jgi:DMSO/TMAO reductase YedYZ molybdopterin-dependent catalytic subunit